MKRARWALAILVAVVLTVGLAGMRAYAEEESPAKGKVTTLTNTIISTKPSKTAKKQTVLPKTGDPSSMMPGFLLGAGLAFVMAGKVLKRNETR